MSQRLQQLLVSGVNMIANMIADVMLLNGLSGWCDSDCLYVAG